MRIGKYKLYTIQSGMFKLDGGAMFGIVPKTLWSRTNHSDESNRIEMCMRVLLLVSDEKKILIDNGIGYKTSNKFKEIYAVDHSEYTLENELNKLGFCTEDITDMILTHLHFDHAGGTSYRDENNELKLRFPNAAHYVQNIHWDWALNPSDRDKASFIHENYSLLEKNKNLSLLKGDDKFDENINLHVINGHTPAQQIVHIHDEKTNLLFSADLFPMSSHIPLPYIMGYDLYPMTTLEEKKKFLPEISKDKWYIFFEHDPYTEICTVSNENGRYFIDKRLKLTDISDE